jgi:hypothetical protein
MPGWIALWSRELDRKMRHVKVGGELQICKSEQKNKSLLRENADC